MAKDLSAQDTFPDLSGWEDSKQKIRDATAAVGALRRALNTLDDQVQSNVNHEAARARGTPGGRRSRLSGSPMAS